MTKSVKVPVRVDDKKIEHQSKPLHPAPQNAKPPEKQKTKLVKVGLDPNDYTKMIYKEVPDKEK